MNKLISMTERVLEVQNLPKDSVNWTYKHLELLFLHAEFLKQPLNLSMFVPCKLVDGAWIVLEEPDLTCKRPESKGFCQCGEESVKDCSEWWNEYQEAKERVLFEGFHIEQHEEKSFSVRCENNILNVMWNHSDERNWFVARGIFTIEDLVKYNLKLTPTALKKIGL
jgi:hypothetical protein